MARKTVGYVHLVWNCPRCGTKNPGPQKFCNGCGGPQPDDTEFEQAAQEALIADEAEIARAKAGPDLHCPYCNARNDGDVKFCGACGGDLAGAQARESGRMVGAHRAEPAGTVNCPSCGTTNPATALSCVACGASLESVPAAKPAERQAKPAERQAEPAGTQKKGGRKGCVILLILIGVVAVAGIFYLLTSTEELTGEVRGVSWTRTIPIEVLGEIEDEDWWDEIPSDADLGSCSSEYRYTQDDYSPDAVEVCGTAYVEDTGGGYGEVVEECVYEVYDDWCDYTVVDWIEIDETTITGSDLNPYWPQVNLLTDQRQGEGVETYEVVFMADDKSYTYTPSNEVQFSQFQPRSEWLLEVNKLNSVVSVNPAE